MHIYLLYLHWILFAKEPQTSPSAVPPSYIHISSSLATGENNKNIADFHFGKGTYITAVQNYYMPRAMQISTL